MSEPELPTSLNPYAPAIDGPLVDQVSDKVTRPPASGGIILFRTLAGVVLSGTIFGMGTAMVMLFFNRSGSDISAIFWMLTLGAIVGLVASFVVALFVVPVVYFFYGLTRATGAPWSGLNIQMFAAGCGFMSGFICIALPYGFTPWGLAAGFVPGGVGALGAWLFTKPLARRTNTALALQDALEDEIKSNHSSDFGNGKSANPFATENK